MPADIVRISPRDMGPIALAAAGNERTDERRFTAARTENGTISTEAGMASRKQQDGDAEAEAAAEIATESALAPTETPAQASSGEADPIRTAAAPEPETPRRPDNPGRNTSERHVEPVRYQKLTDDRLKKIPFRLELPEGQDKPGAEVLKVMCPHKQTAEGQSTGLKCKTARAHGPVWTIPDDPEGRALADKNRV